MTRPARAGSDNAREPIQPVGSESDDAGDVTRLEQDLLHPDVRSSVASVEALLHPDFVEFGASGRVWNRDAIAAALADDPAVRGEAVDFVPTVLAENVVLLTYRIVGEPGSLRSSVWVKDESAGWQLRFHQGTRTG